MTVKETKEKIQKTLLPILDKRDAFLLDVNIRFERGARIIQAFVDTDKGITIDECADISRDLSHEIDSVQVLEGVTYQLEISSPGLDRPLKLLRQYHKNVGRRFKVKYSTEAEPAFLTATLVAVADDKVTFQQENGEALTIPFSQIIESREELPW